MAGFTITGFTSTGFVTGSSQLGNFRTVTVLIPNKKGDLFFCKKNHIIFM